MKHRDLRCRKGCRLLIHTTERPSIREFHLTAWVEEASDPLEAAGDVLGLVSQALAEHSIETMQEKLYGLKEMRDEVLKLRAELYRQRIPGDPAICTWIQGTPLQGCAFAGLQLWGLARRDGLACVEHRRIDGLSSGRLFDAGDFRLLLLPGLTGVDAEGHLAPEPAVQADRLFSRLEFALRTEGLTLAHLIRTWIYAPKLLDWYGDLNAVRTRHYTAAGFGSTGGPAFPASTGIQGQSDEEACLVDALALERSPDSRLKVEPVLGSSRQDASFRYGSAFSRGMGLVFEGMRTLHLSGTASIDRGGATLHVGDPEKQCLETLLCLAAILKDHGGGLEDICSATLFCKTPEVLGVWQRVTGLLGLPDIPMVVMQADVCRHELLVEMEAIAVLKT